MGFLIKNQTSPKIFILILVSNFAELFKFEV
jgi:hypothetical protein